MNQEIFVMESVVGIFATRAEAENAIARLESAGIAGTHINFLTPGDSDQQIKKVPVTEAEQYGPGEAIGGVVGGAMGAAGGMSLATMFLPGVGPIVVRECWARPSLAQWALWEPRQLAKLSIWQREWR